MKTDTNTRGNTFWFMFKVANFQLDQEVFFNIHNFSRNVDTFYNDKMNILVKISGENLEDEAIKDVWQYDKCTNVKFDESQVCKPNGDPYFHLRFKYKFEH